TGDIETDYSKTGHFGAPKLRLGTKRQTTKERDCPVQNGTYGHISHYRTGCSIFLKPGSHLPAVTSGKTE
ncbi:hypothetical protein AVEN_101749-1, partial [Araneus ventricosus]